MSRRTAVLSQMNHRRQRATRQWPDRWLSLSRRTVPKLQIMWPSRLLCPTSVVLMKTRLWVIASIMISISRTKNSLKCIIRCLHHQRLFRLLPLWIKTRDFKTWSNNTLLSSTAYEQSLDLSQLKMKQAHVKILKLSKVWVPENFQTT